MHARMEQAKKRAYSSSVGSSIQIGTIMMSNLTSQQVSMA